MHPRLALRLNPKDSPVGTNQLPAANDARQNPPRPHSPYSTCRIQSRLFCVRSIISLPPPKTQGSAFSPARLDFDTSAHRATAKPTRSSTAQSSLREFVRALSPIVRRVKPGLDSLRPSRLPRGRPALRLGQRIVSPEFDR